MLRLLSRRAVLPRAPAWGSYSARRPLSGSPALLARRPRTVPPATPRPSSAASTPFPHANSAAMAGEVSSSSSSDVESSDADADSDVDPDMSAEDIREVADENSTSLRIEDQDMLVEHLLSVSEPEFRPIALRDLETDAYEPVAPNTRWVRLRGVRGVEVPIPRSWRAWVGEGVCFGIPFRTWHLALSPPGTAVTTVALSVTLYKGAYSAPTLRATPYTGALGVTQLLAQVHQVRRCAPGSVAVSEPEAALARRRSLFPRDVDTGYEADQQAAWDASAAAGGRGRRSGSGGDDDDGVGGNAEELGPRITGSWRHDSTRAQMLPHTVSRGGAAAAAAAAAAAVLPSDVAAALGPLAKLMPSSSAGSSSAAGTRERPRRGNDPVTVLALEYEAPRWEGRWGGGHEGVAAMSPDDAAAAREADEAVGDLRHSVTWVADPYADTLHEVTFTAPAEAWDAVWAHEDDLEFDSDEEEEEEEDVDDDDDDDDDGDDEEEEEEEEGADGAAVGAEGAGEGATALQRLPPRREQPQRGPPIVALWGMRDLSGRALMDHLTITGVRDEDVAAGAGLRLPEPAIDAVAVEQGPPPEDSDGGEEGEEGVHASRRRSARLAARVAEALNRRAARARRPRE